MPSNPTDLKVPTSSRASSCRVGILETTSRHRRIIVAFLQAVLKGNHQASSSDSCSFVSGATVAGLASGVLCMEKRTFSTGSMQFSTFVAVLSILSRWKPRPPVPHISTAEGGYTARNTVFIIVEVSMRVTSRSGSTVPLRGSSSPSSSSPS
ncbi:uncharacterized protein THITE_2129383 [Thermothielavioides terrestris NRRL 8126]|uniref:Uncharacterized protein n=1 Tax=Thermothielavioides terrestris (strain ATCC 38088 / NRRL 8126) TaxID=578455 RepID=G2R5J5_THETT|nr:uncharacterized protein THITE_2129383 [Thermothielavioides terrestris NRRL 8126]AEO67486.1 hypothetical protein THITE_2129383 [Thermothielavioides terrestris NRRL 8126]